MKEKKDLILKCCRDFIFLKVFNSNYDNVCRLYAKDKIDRDIDAYLDNLITRGELFYGDNFTNDFIKERTNEARDYLINDLNSYDMPETYESVVGELKRCGLSEDKANEFIKNHVKDKNILDGALNYFDKKNIPNIEPIKDDKMERIPVKTEEPSKKLLEKFKEKWSTPSFRKKIIITAGVMAIGAIITAFSPEMQSFISNLLPGDMLSDNTASNWIADRFNDISDSVQNNDNWISNRVNDINDSIQNNVSNDNLIASNDSTNVLDTSSWNMEGISVSDNAAGAVSGGDLTANEWFSNRLQGLYDTSTGKMLDVSSTDLQDADFVKKVLQNDNIAAVFGDGKIGTLKDVDGFVNGDVVENLIRSR